MEEKQDYEITVELADKMAYDLAYIAQWEHCSIKELVEQYLEDSLKNIPNLQ